MIDVVLTENPLSSVVCENKVTSPDCGGIVTFTGTVRNATQDRQVRHLEFESYEKMAVSEMQKICRLALERFAVKAISMHHRVGHLSIGEIAVVISVAAPHRKAAFQACEFAIDTLKETVPIWKKEIFEDGEVWVSAHP
jgi:molybdopterin synthase catalytic subunit